MNLLRYIHTLRHLRPIQIYGRAWQRLYQPRLDLRPAPPLRERRGHWAPPAQRPPAMLGERRFRFLNEERLLDWPAGWSDPSIHRLWLFHLHYFEDLTAAQFDRRAAWHHSLIDQWISDNMQRCQGPAWVPYVTSLRITNWIKWALAGQALSPRAIAALARQVRYLRRRLETHLLGNHLLANAKALVFAGLYFAGDEAQRWLAAGLRILDRQLPEQILADGGHYELSPMYQSLVLEDLLDLINIARVYPAALPLQFASIVDQWRAYAKRAAQWLAAMTFPDGQIALFNDAAFNVAPAPAALRAYAERLQLGPPSPPGEGITELRASGYLRLQSGPAVAIVDVGEIGASFLPGHGHADVLTFELALFDQRVIVNSGTSVYYGNDAERLRQRSTPAHNTVTVDNHDSSEVWDNFRVARRAHPRDLEIEHRPDGTLLVACSHDGYRRLRGRVTHRRHWRLVPDRLDVHDDLSGHWHGACARFHLDPSVEVELQTSDRLELSFGGRPLLCAPQVATLRVEPSTYHPEFGLAIANQCVRARMTGSRAAYHLGWPRY